jgi:hypothetical protein
LQTDGVDILQDVTAGVSGQFAVRAGGGQNLLRSIENMRQELVWLCDQLEQRKRESGQKDKNDDKEMAKAIESHMSMSEVKSEQRKRARLLAESLSEAVEVGTFVRLADMTTVESQLFLVRTAQLCSC